ncbi:MAG: RluA family pseudouridine synthase [Bacteroidetes bacterium]|nr:RluA family pseudouridine synthase [Bacteroidota bacterium]
MNSIESVKSRILFEDNHLIIINKLPKEIVQRDKTGDQSLIDIVKEYIKEEYFKPGNVFLGLVHRIDRPVSGALILAKTSKALTRMNEQIKNRDIQKIYWAIVKNKPEPKTGQLTHWLVKNPKNNKSTAFDREQKETKKAVLNYKLLDQSKDYHLVEVELLTGRHHQIRTQLSKIACPIKGDLKYGSPRSNKDASISLHARQLIFTHPVTKEKVDIKADPPNDPLWDFFLKNAN